MVSTAVRIPEGLSISVVSKGDRGATRLWADLPRATHLGSTRGFSSSKQDQESKNDELEECDPAKTASPQEKSQNGGHGSRHPGW